MPPVVLLFSYGSLQRKEVQIANFGRALSGRPDALPGYMQTRVPILDLEVEAALGDTHYANVIPSSRPNDAVEGTVFEMTEEELTAADRYEEDARYYRIPVTLRSGVQAWVYRRA